jgi:hypothetical protein
MHAHLGGRQGEDQSAIARVDVVPTENVAKRGPELLSLGRVEQNVRAGDRH